MSKKIDMKINDNPNYDENIFIALFKKGADEFLEQDLLADLPDDGSIENFLPSETFKIRIKNRINKAIRQERNKRLIKRLPKITASFVIVLLIFSITVYSVEGLRVKFLNLFIHTQDIVTDIYIEDSNLTEIEEGIKTNVPKYIPDGYTLSSNDKSTLVYTNNNSNMIKIYTHDVGDNICVDTENAEYGNITINTYDGFYSIKNGNITLVFKTEEYAYSILADIILEVVKIAESIK